MIPALIAGSATAGAISLGFGSASIVPHGGMLDVFVPHAITHLASWLLALAVGTAVTAGVLFFTKKPIAAEEPAAELAVAA